MILELTIQNRDVISIVLEWSVLRMPLSDLTAPAAPKSAAGVPQNI